MFTLDNLPYEIRRLLPGDECFIQKLYMEKIDLKYSCLCAFAAVFFFVFGLPQPLLDDYMNEEIILHKISIRGYYFFRQLIIKYYSPTREYRGAILTLVIGNNDFLGYYIGQHLRDPEFCLLQPTHYETFRIATFNEPEHTAHHITRISLMANEHPSYPGSVLHTNPRHFLNRVMLVPIYYHYDHIFLLDDDNYSNYVRICISNLLR